MKRVIHFGPAGDRPGGMAQVVQGYLDWSTSRLSVSSVMTTRGKHDPISPFLWCVALVKITITRMIKGHADTSMVFHISEGGSFLREGSLLIFSRLLRFRSVAHIHGAVFQQFASRHPRIAKSPLRWANMCLVLTEEHRNLLNELGIAESRIKVAPNLVEVHPFNENKKPRVIFCGEVSTRKGADVLLEAWKQAVPDSQWELHIVGPKSESFELPHSLPPQASYLGPLSHDDTIAEQRQAAIAVLPSRHEALPMFLLEAMAQSCAVISTRVGQVSQLLADEAGILVRPGSVDELASALRAMMHNDCIRTRLAKRGHARVSESYGLDSGRSQLVAYWTGIEDQEGIKC